MSPFLLVLKFLHVSTRPIILCTIRWNLGMWDMEEKVESFSEKELHAKINMGRPLFLGDENRESISH